MYILRFSVLCERCRSLPHLDADHWKPLAARVVEDQTRDALDGGIAVEKKHRLAQLLQWLHQRIVVTQQHFVIDLLIDPALDDSLDIAEVAHHVAAVELSGAHFDFCDRIVPMRMLADAVVVEQPMAITEINTFSDRIHFGHCMPTAVLVSCGLESAVLLAEEYARGDV